MGRKKKVNDTEVYTDDEEKADDLKALEAQRNDLINQIKPKLLSKTQLKQGGSRIRVAYEREKGYEAVINEINELGKKLGLGLIGLGDLRKG